MFTLIYYFFELRINKSKKILLSAIYTSNLKALAGELSTKMHSLSWDLTLSYTYMQKGLRCHWGVLLTYNYEQALYPHHELGVIII